VTYLFNYGLRAVFIFQYPRTDRRCCDQRQFLESTADVIAFSILERIDDVVTVTLDGIERQLVDFQYPRTDRRCCDLLSQATANIQHATFSILERIDDVVTSEVKDGREWPF